MTTRTAIARMLYFFHLVARTPELSDKITDEDKKAAELLIKEFLHHPGGL